MQDVHTVVRQGGRGRRRFVTSHAYEPRPSTTGCSVSLMQVQTVDEWCARGYRGLRVMCCPECGQETRSTWEELGATPDEDVVAVAKRVRCEVCLHPPAGLAVVTYKEAA